MRSAACVGNLPHSTPIPVGAIRLRAVEAKRIVIDEAQCGIDFTPENAEEMVECVKKLRDDEAQRETLGDNGRRAVTRDYLRANLADRMMDAIVSRVPGH